MTQKFSKSPKSSRSSESSLKKAPLPPFPFAPHVKNAAKEKRGADSGLEEAFKMIDEYKKKHAEIERELDEIYRNAGMTPRELRTYLENPANFSKEEWERMERERQSLIYSLISEKEPSKSEQKLKTALTPSPQVASSSETKGRRKMQGARRNWIPMK